MEWISSRQHWADRVIAAQRSRQRGWKWLPAHSYCWTVIVRHWLHLTITNNTTKPLGLSHCWGHTNGESEPRLNLNSKHLAWECRKAGNFLTWVNTQFQKRLFQYLDLTFCSETHGLRCDEWGDKCWYLRDVSIKYGTIEVHVDLSWGRATETGTLDQCSSVWGIKGAMCLAERRPVCAAAPCSWETWAQLHAPPATSTTVQGEADLDPLNRCTWEDCNSSYAGICGTLIHPWQT